ncbi:hypothetical protein G5V57_22940 [Nordella sp. HKS 07]|uniref:hypothetical protein n=1 Tax=Nordella sp. HKS 07 TaxID=2712222 RepID=UPI0013E13E42|nr:hypothetical protein [Nordella sp. HKS 07]QIG50331.1 hypothetical protein G5V57_22940 [Nordella sp. HKS 07]
MKRLSNSELKSNFIAWQCRLRQMAMRDHGGTPMPGFRPQVASLMGEIIIPEMTILLVPNNPEESTAFFKFQLQKTNDHRQAFEAGLKYLAADFYQLPELFSDEITAVFAKGSATAARLVKFKTVLLDFEQYAQRYRLSCAVKRLAPRDISREASLWHNRLFNPNLGNDAEVLSFRPNWKNAMAEPWPG